MLVLSRDLLAADRALRAGRWLNPQYDPAVPLASLVGARTLVILGTGEIGASAASLCRRLGLTCVGVNRELPNVLLTPHVSGTTADTFRHRTEDIAANVLALLSGAPLRHEVPRPGSRP